jgi:hypothetical protein
MALQAMLLYQVGFIPMSIDACLGAVESINIFQVTVHTCWKMHQKNNLKHKQNASGVSPVTGLVTVAVDEEMTQASATFQH